MCRYLKQVIAATQNLIILFHLLLRNYIFLFPGLEMYVGPNFMFCWPCLRKIRVMKTNFMRYLSSVYFVSQPLHVSVIFEAHHQWVYCVYTTRTLSRTKIHRLKFSKSRTGSHVTYSAVIIRIVLLFPCLRIRGVSPSSIHYNQSHRVYINRRQQYTCLI